MLNCSEQSTGLGVVGEGDIYSSRHFLFLFFTGGGHRTARMASSNTVLRPRCVSAEHSRYFTAPAGSTQAITKRFSTLRAGLLRTPQQKPGIDFNYGTTSSTHKIQVKSTRTPLLSYRSLLPWRGPVGR